MKALIAVLMIFQVTNSLCQTSLCTYELLAKEIDNAQDFNVKNRKLLESKLSVFPISKIGSYREKTEEDPIVIPVDDSIFSISLTKGTTTDFSYMSASYGQPSYYAVGIFTLEDSLFEGVIVHLDSLYMLTMPGEWNVYDIYFDLTPVAMFPVGTYDVKVVSFFYNSNNEIIGGNIRENINLTIQGEDNILNAGYIGIPTNGTAPLTVSFTDNSVGNISNWSWDFGDGNTSSEQNPSHTYTVAGTYTVTLIVSGAGGADTLSQKDYITITNVTGTESNKIENVLKIYPNPANLSCIIKFMLEKESNVNISAFNSQGQMVKIFHNGTLSPNSYEIETDISDLSEGLYQILLKTNSFNVIRKLVVIK